MSSSDSQIDPYSDYLPDTIEECHALITALRKEVQRLLAIADTMKTLEERVAELEKQVRRRNRMIFGKKSAKVPAAKLTGTGKEIYDRSLHDLEPEMSSLLPATEDKKHGGGGRIATKNTKMIPRTFEHEIKDPAKLLCPCCGEIRQRIGFEVSYQLDVLNTVFELLKNVQFKYACPKCQSQIITAPKPHQPIAKGYAGPGLIAHIGRSKFDWHLPLYRQERIYRGQSINIGRSSMCRILKEGADLLDHIVKRMHQLMLKSRIIQSDATTMPVIKKGLGQTHTGYTWLYRDEKYIIYDFSEGGGRENPERILNGFKGVLLTDGAAVYNSIIKGGAKRAGCSSHAFRYFEDAKKEDPEKADVALAYFKSLFDIERVAWQLSEEERKEFRRRHSKPKLAELKLWLDRQMIEPKTALGEALTYCKNQWDALCYFADNGFVPMHNNDSENGLRPAVLGRRNWLFAGSVEGGRTAATWMSIIHTCRRHSIDPFVYLQDLFTRLPSTPTSQIDQFLPDKWKALRAESDQR